MADLNPSCPPVRFLPWAVEELWLSCPLVQTKEGGGRASAWPTVAPAAVSQWEASHSIWGPVSLQLPHPWPPQICHSPCAFCGTLPLGNPRFSNVLLAQYQPLYVQPIMYLLSITNSSLFLVRTPGFGISSFFFNVLRIGMLWFWKEKEATERLCLVPELQASEILRQVSSWMKAKCKTWVGFASAFRSNLNFLWSTKAILGSLMKEPDSLDSSCGKWIWYWHCLKNKF